MNVKEAVQLAMRHTADLFESEAITNLGLEEVVFDDAKQEWDITVGFSRPWDYSIAKSYVSSLANPSGQPGRSFKIIRVRDLGTNGEIVAVKSRPSGD